MDTRAESSKTNIYAAAFIFIRVPSNGVIRNTLHFQFYFELKETFEKIKLPQLLATNCGIIKKYLHPNRTFIS
jgi:hypothetical protein